MSKPTVVKVEIKWSENTELNKTRPVYRSLREMDLWLGNVAIRTIPEEQRGYDKTGFVITWSDGETYEGRLDMKRDEYSIREHARNFLTFYSGRARPYHITAEQYKEFLARQKPEEIADAGDWLDNREWN